jgi:hypothetical protein
MRIRFCTSNYEYKISITLKGQKYHYILLPTRQHTWSDWLIPLVSRFQAWVCGCSFIGIAGSNPAGAWMSLVSVLCLQAEVSMTGRSLVQRSPNICVSLSVIRCKSNPYTYNKYAEEVKIRNKYIYI